MSDVAVALLAGGLATRLRPITETIPKALVEVAGRPFIEHQLLLLARHGVRRAVLCLGYRGEQVEQRLGAKFESIALDYSYDGPELLGTAGALRNAAPLLSDVFWVLYGDSYLPVDYHAILESFERTQALGLMTVYRNDNRHDKSNAIFVNGMLEKYDKRLPDPRMTYIDYGLALLRRSVLARIPEGQSVDLADIYSQLVAVREMIGYEVNQRFYEIGSPEGLSETHAYLEARGRDAIV